MHIEFRINNLDYKIDSTVIPIETSLNTFIRENANLRGTKFMCQEGGCGACIVALRTIHPVTKVECTMAVNSCLFPIFSCHGCEITTIEGIGNKKDGYHKIQKSLYEFNGTQCGYCSPGMIMNMYSLQASENVNLTMAEIENSFGGNICRCTGYRPILDAFKSLASDADPNIVKPCTVDIEDVNKICQKTGNKCKSNCNLKRSQNQVELKFNDNREWFKVFNLDKLFDILENLGNKSYMLVAGNTGHGVFRRDPNIKVFIDINGVEELRTHSIGTGIVIGGNVSLTETMKIFEKASKLHANFEYTKELNKHIDLIANVAVRNFGTIAGNLILKHQNQNFPSDLFLILETAGAKVTIREARRKTNVMSLPEFLKLNMSKKVILNVILPRLENERFIFRSYKIMPRAQNTHAYVNAGFLVEKVKTKIVNFKLCFGGIDSPRVHAEKTENYFIKNSIQFKNLFSNEILQDVLNILSSELNPIDNHEFSAIYRKNLALGLFYKYILNICPVELLKSDYTSGGSILKRELSSGKQIYDKFDDIAPVAQAVKKHEGLIQCSGEAIYSNDIPKQPNELWAAFVCATKVNWTLKSIDATKALKIAGVHAFYSAKEIPGRNSFISPILMFLDEDEEIFCSNKVLFNGQPIGVIIADNYDLANHAVKFVQVEYLKPQIDHIYTSINDVLADKNANEITEMPFFNLNATSYGNNLRHKLEGNFELGSQFHNSIEPQTCVCIPTDDGLDVYSATQWMDLVQIAVAQCLGVRENEINMNVRRLGGGFGGKISRSSQIACACALACYKLNKPIRFVMKLEPNMEIFGKRFSYKSKYAIDVDDSGVIQKLQMDYYHDYGCSLNEKIGYYTTVGFQNCYDSHSFDAKSFAVKTNTPSNTACRAPGTTEGIATIEHIMEHIAFSLNLDPVNVRIANLDKASPIKGLSIEFLNSINYYERKKEIDEFNNRNRWKKRGISVVPMKFDIEFFGHFPAFVAIYHADGSVAITHGGIEMGQGINTKASQVASFTLGIPINLIKIKASNNITAANSLVSGGSVTSDVICFAVMKSCEILKERLKPIRDKMPGKSWEEITNAAYNEDIDLTASYQCVGKSEIGNYDVWGISCAEVEVDTLTGNYLINRVDILEDTGKSLSPLIDIGQIEGAFVMGLGYWLTEEIIYDPKNGELLTNRSWNYKPPGAKDIPIDFRIQFIHNTNTKTSVLRSKSTGEPAFAMSIVAVFALRYAINSARHDAGLPREWYELKFPLSPEVVVLACGNKITDFKIK